MSCSVFENLPLLILETVCECLSNIDQGRRSLFAFSLASKRCCAIADRQRFELVHLSVEDGQQLARSLGRWDDVLQIDRRFRYVRRLKVTARMRIDDEDPWLAVQAQTFQEGLQISGERDDDEGEQGFSRPIYQWTFDGSDPFVTPDVWARYNQLWQPLVQFLCNCPGLGHMIWASADQFPRCVLDILHTRLPHCRLHLQSFSLPSLSYERQPLHNNEEDEYALVTSQSLSGIHATVINYWDVDGTYKDFNQPLEEAITRMVAGLAPNLKSLSIWYRQRRTFNGWLPSLPGSIVSSIPPRVFMGQPSRPQPQMLQGQLTTLELGMKGEGLIPGLNIDYWRRCTDFSVLETLILRCKLNLEALQSLVEAAETGELKSLRTFEHFGLCSGARIWPRPVYDDSGFQEVLETKFLFNLRPLQDLTIEEGLASRTKNLRNSDFIKATITTLLAHHGQVLTRLHLPASWSLLLSENGLDGLRNRCLNVRALELTVKRSQGDDSEVRLYRGLGSFPILKRLTLNYQVCLPFGEEDEERLLRSQSTADMDDFRNILLKNYYADTDVDPYDEEGEAQRKEELLERVSSALICSAIDAPLAQSIFLVILAANRAARSPGLPPSFCSLQLRLQDFARGQGIFGRFNSLLHWIAHNWVCERVLGGAQSEEVTIRGIGETEKPVLKKSCRHLDQSRMSDAQRDCEMFKPVWESIWPEAKGEENWMDIWKSVPLSLETENAD